MQHRDHAHRRRKLGARAALIAATTAGALCLAAAPALAQTGPVSPTAVKGTPTLVATGTTTETIRQVADCGGTMYAVGSFTQISGYNGTTTQTFTRNNIFSFSETAPFTVTAWAPDVNGEVNSIAFSNGNCADAYIGGQFTSVNGTTVGNIAEVDTTTGNVVTGFKGKAGGGHVDTILAVDGHLLVGGTFTSIGGNKGANPYYASLNPATGTDDGFLHLNISGHITFKGVKANSTDVYNQQLSHGGTLVLVEGDFTSVGGQNRRQIFMIDVSGSTAKLTGWTSPEFDGSDPNGTLNPNDKYFNCGTSHPFYIHAAAWSPDDQTIYVADTGVKAILWNGTFPVVGLCDAAAAFPATQSQVFSDWIAYDGCDSLYSAAADDSAVYVAGHNRWFNNQNACNTEGPGAIPAPGLAGLTPGASGGTLIRNSAGTAGLYSRSRGHGADDMLLTTAGLWIASDNFGGGTSCGGKAGFSGLCFLPYTS
jgi:hypothetical protein